MAIIYSFQGKTNLAGDDIFVINDSADSNKTKNTTLSDITTYVDNNLSYDLQQVLTSGADAYAPIGVGVWNGIIQLGNDSGTGPFYNITIDSSIGAANRIDVTGGDIRTARAIVGNEGKFSTSVEVAGDLFLDESGSKSQVRTINTGLSLEAGSFALDIVSPNNINATAGGNFVVNASDVDVNATTNVDVTGINIAIDASGTLDLDGSSVINIGGGSGSNFEINIGNTNADRIYMRAEAAQWNPSTAGQTFTFDGDVRFNNNFLDSAGNAPASGKYLGGNGTTVLWKDESEIDVTKVIKNVTNQSGAALDIGTPVYLDSNPSGTPRVIKAQATGDMPASGLVIDASIANGSDGQIILIGLLEAIPIGKFTGTAPTVGDIVYVSSTAGTLTVDRPIGNAGIQNVGIVSRTSGQIDIVVTCSGRTNDLPNGNTYELWTSDSNGIPIQTGSTLTVDPGALSLTTMQGKLAAEVEFQVGTANLAIGTSSLINYSAAGGNNTAYGVESLANSTDGTNNTAIGYSAGHNIDGVANSNNVHVGWRAGDNGVDQAQNTVLGSRALQNAGGTMSDNVVIGYLAASSATNLFTTDNVIIGSDAGFQAAGEGNVVIGKSSGRLVSDGNVVIGKQAGAVYAGDENAYVGLFAGQNSTGGAIACFGGRAGGSITTASRSTYIGYMAGGATQQSGSSNVLVGSSADTELVDTSEAVAVGDSTNVGAGSVAIGNGAVGTGSGNVAVGNASNTNGLELVVAVGQGAIANGSLSTILGSGSNGVDLTTVVGSNATASAVNGVAIGHQANSAGGLAINISGGPMAIAPGPNDISIEGLAPAGPPAGAAVAGQRIVINGTVYTLALY
jgi:hypothetical protein